MNRNSLSISLDKSSASATPQLHGAPGYLPFSRRFSPTPQAAATPVLHCHGEADQMVRLPWAEAGVQRLKEVPHGGSYDTHGDNAWHEPCSTMATG